MKALITGITGFAGSHLAEFLLAGGHQVFGTRRVRSPMEDLAEVAERVTLFDCELTDTSAVRSVLADVKPEFIFHLAAQSFVQASWAYPGYTLFNNLSAQLNVLEAVRELKLDPRIQIACSSEEYGRVEKNDLPLTEETPLRPLSPYGVSKVAQDLLGFQYYTSYGMRIVRTRAFNHTGPRRGEVFATSNFAKQLVESELGKRKPVIQVGNLSAQRDFTDVRDVVRAYYLACTEGEPGEVYNICSGQSVSLQEVLNMLIELSGCEVTVEVDPARLRPSDVQILRGDASKLTAATGWQPTIQLRQTLEDLLNYWRGRLVSS
ncbi:MAG: GDP-mannose 4,6-dehydratase [Candidatus Riflebacteria bacterium RBG_13_59_9]|nr:MAG: GDP-mannose 4,6-dehydratase [Candidatus Riflebacteria bacterium RBG_13_59_9]